LRGFYHRVCGRCLIPFELVVVENLIVEVVFLVELLIFVIVGEIVGFFFELFVYFDFVADDSAGLVPRFFETGAGVCWVKVALHRWASSLTIWNSCSRSAATS
jgi:hypothetical protein